MRRHSAVLAVLFALLLALAGCGGGGGGGGHHSNSDGSGDGGGGGDGDDDGGDDGGDGGGETGVGINVKVMRPSSSESQSSGLQAPPGHYLISPSAQYLEIRATDLSASANRYWIEIDFSGTDCETVEYPVGSGELVDACSKLFPVPPEIYDIEVISVESMTQNPFSDMFTGGTVKIDEYGTVTDLAVCVEGDIACDGDTDGQTDADIELSTASLVFNPEQASPVFYGSNKQLKAVAKNLPDDVLSGGALFAQITDVSGPLSSATATPFCGDVGAITGPGETTFQCTGTAPGPSDAPDGTLGDLIRFAALLTVDNEWAFPGQVFDMTDVAIVVSSDDLDFMLAESWFNLFIH